VLNAWVLDVPSRAIDDSWRGLHVLESKTLRFVPFKDGRVHYQVDGLGSGSGYWEIRKGAMHVFAQRPRFDMHWIVSGARGGTNEDWIVQFRDRFGVQREDVVLIKDQVNRSLRPFTSSEFNL
jgi:hypothetical protein